MTAALGLALVFLLIMARVPVGVAMLGVGFAGFAAVVGVRPAAVDGKRIRVPGPVVEKVTTTLGMVPISSSVTDAYE